MSPSRILQLAQIIVSQTSVIDQHIQHNNLAEPSFKPGSPVEPIQDTTPKIEEAKNKAVEATIELRQLLEGPMNLLLPEASLLSAIELLIPNARNAISPSLLAIYEEDHRVTMGISTYLDGNYGSISIRQSY